jgi:CBS domain-containing protein
MRAADVMTPDVFTVTPDMEIQKLAMLLSEKSISGAPVVDSGGQMIGIVSEGDLLHRAEIDTERPAGPRPSWWLDDFASGVARDYVKSHGRTVGDIMTRDVASVAEDTSLADIATLLETRRVKRVPVVRDGKIVGIVSRSNLVRALGAVRSTPAFGPVEDDRSTRANLILEMRNQPWAGKVWAQDVLVNDGVVHLWFGSNEPSERREAARVLAGNFPGVRGVEVHVMPVPNLPGI